MTVADLTKKLASLGPNAKAFIETDAGAVEPKAVESVDDARSVPRRRDQA